MVQKWFGIKQLHFERRGKKNLAIRQEVLLKAKNADAALEKARKFGKEKKLIPNNVKWEYVGAVALYECFMPPGKESVLVCIKDYGNDWCDGFKHVHSGIDYDLINHSWGNLNEYKYFIASLVYIVRKTEKRKRSKKDKIKITTIELMFSPLKGKGILETVYTLALQKQIKRKVLKVRLDSMLNDNVEFIGLDDIRPVYFPCIVDGMELNRTVQQYKNKKSISKLLPSIDNLIAPWK